MQPEKISPALLLALKDFQDERRVGLTPHMQTLGVFPALNSPKPPRTVVFIYCDEDARLDHLEQHGIIINQPRGRVRTAFLPMESLEILSDDPAIHRIKPSRYLNKFMDVAPGKVNLPQFRESSGLTGKGVVIGIVDTGIDPKHPAFAGRILRIWDQTLNGPGVAEGSYGLEVSGDTLVASRDTDGHGTHVAGIASAQDDTYGGVAPEAELVIVRTDLQDAHIADGVRYIFRVADELGRPAVVNLSLGGHADAHDGSDSLSQIINAESGPGRIVCCAAGNEGNDNIHGQKDVPRGSTRTMRFHVPDGVVGIAWLNGWYPGESSFEISVRTPGKFVTPFQKVIAKGNPVREYTLPDAKVEIVTPGPDQANGDHNFFVQIGGGRTPIKGGIWQLRIRNTSKNDGRLDVWTLDDRSSVFFSGTSITDAVKIGSPGASSSAVTVASYTTKVKWTDVNGSEQEVGLELDDISDFSSEGPLRNGAQKPDVAAPGAMIVSALSADSETDPASRVSDKFVVLAGTSMASPFITGIVALLLERDPQLDPDKVKELLRKNSLIPGQEPGTFDNKWGFGLVNAAEL